LIDAIDQKHESFGWIFEQDCAASRTSQLAMNWLEEAVDVVDGLSGELS
jgi:hypothetical protein